MQTSTRGDRIKGASSLRRERQKQELRQKILDVASELFLEKGYEKFSLRQVAERIGYSPTTIYLYFQNKDDLIMATVQEGFDGFDRRMIEIASTTPDPLERIEKLGRAYIDFGLQNPALYRLMFMQRSDFYIMPRLDDEVLDVIGKDLAAPWPTDSDGEQPRTLARRLLVTAVREGMEAGVLRPGTPLDVADVLWAGTHGLVSLAISPLLSDGHAHNVIETMLDVLIEGVKAH